LAINSVNPKGEISMKRAAARHILVDTEKQCLQDFATLAREYSSCPSKAQGGDLGTFSPGMMVKEFDQVVFSAKVNSIQGPVKTQFGYHLLEVTERSD
jgi:peptidyl-prolyl cis-trans isomerase C